MKRNSLVYKDRLSVEDCEIVDLADGRGENKKKEKGNSSIFFFATFCFVSFFSVKVPVKKKSEKKMKNREKSLVICFYSIFLFFSFFFFKGRP